MDLNATQAAIRAGYTAKDADVQGPRLLGNAGIAAAVQAGMEKRAARVEVTADYVLRNLTEVLERCMQRAPVMVREGRQMVQLVDGDGSHVWEFNATGANKSLELLGKHLKLFTEKHDHTHNFDGQTDEQLEARYRALVARATATVIGGES